MMNVGELLAKWAIEGAAQGSQSTRNGEPARMCSGCAFKLGTPANGEQPAALRAMECLLTDNLIFNCHQERETICAGYLLAKRATE